MNTLSDAVAQLADALRSTEGAGASRLRVPAEVGRRLLAEQPSARPSLRADGYHLDFGRLRVSWPFPK